MARNFILVITLMVLSLVVFGCTKNVKIGTYKSGDCFVSEEYGVIMQVEEVREETKSYGLDYSKGTRRNFFDYGIEQFDRETKVLLEEKVVVLVECKSLEIKAQQ